MVVYSWGMAHALPNLTRAILGRPLAIKPDKLRTILAVVTRAADVEQTEAREPRSYAVDSDGIATIPVQGTLTSKSYGVEALSGLTGYDALGAMIADAHADPEVRGVLLDVDSPGGDVVGLFELVDALAALGADKPVFASVNSEAYSAAYALASQADQVFVQPRTGGVGSIGVVAAHVDQSAADASEGLAYTFVYAGERKIDANPHQPLTGEALEDMRRTVDKAYAMFVDAVAEGRGMDAAAVRGTEAATYFGADEAIAAGLADEAGTLNDARAALAARLERAKQGAITVTKPTMQERFEALRAEHARELAARDELIARFQAADAERIEAERDAYVDSLIRQALEAGAPLEAAQVETVRERFAADDDKGARVIGEALLGAAMARATKATPTTLTRIDAQPTVNTKPSAKPGEGWKQLMKGAR